MKRILPLLLALFPLVASAGVDLLQWKPAGYPFSFVIPKRDQESPEQALSRYLGALEKNPELKKYRAYLNASAGDSFAPFESSAKGPSILAVANDPEDLTAKPRRMHFTLDPLDRRGAKTALIPIAVTTGLPEAEAREFRTKVKREIDGLIAVGGDDIHPSLFKDPDPKGLSVQTNLSRDVEEMKLVRDYLKEGKGFFSGVCRGHQMGGVASGCQLVKDIREELDLVHPRRVDHALKPTADAGPLTREIFDGVDSISVLSYHHQAVKKPGVNNPRIKVTAVAETQPGISEVSEYYGRRGLSVQTHPELMPGTDFHERYYNQLFREADQAHARRVNRPFKNIDLDSTLFGIEYTFQDQGMVDEPGRMTMETPHKRARFEAFKKNYLNELGLDEKALASFGRKDFKPGETINVPGDGKHVMNMEPVTIEVNTQPKLFNEIEPAAEPIFRAAGNADLVGYVNPAAERSGMGHIHVGARTIGESPFYKNPLLLRNMMVYEHKHPSVLWGFAEAYDIDNFAIPTNNNVTNIETYHKPEQQAAFERAVKKFDAWYAKTKAEGGDLSDGLRQFLKALKSENNAHVDFFRHYRFMNLEHMQEIANSPVPVDPKKAGKYTVEFRNFRPPRTPKHASAHAEFLLAMMDKQAEPGHFEKFVNISPQEYDRFHSATRAAADWELVKRDLGRHNPLWDDSVNEYLNVQLKEKPLKLPLANGAEAEAYHAYSPKSEKGNKFELRVPVKDDKAPDLVVNDRAVRFERVQVGGKEYWVSVVDKPQLKELSAAALKASPKRLDCPVSFSFLAAQ